MLRPESHVQTWPVYLPGFATGAGSWLVPAGGAAGVMTVVCALALSEHPIRTTTVIAMTAGFMASLRCDSPHTEPLAVERDTRGMPGGKSAKTRAVTSWDGRSVLVSVKEVQGRERCVSGRRSGLRGEPETERGHEDAEIRRGPSARPLHDERRAGAGRHGADVGHAARHDLAGGIEGLGGDINGDRVGPAVFENPPGDRCLWVGTL